MAFLDWLPGGDHWDDGDNPYKVDNSPEEVRRRLTYLRLVPDCDTASLDAGKWLEPKAMAELPREISCSVMMASYFVAMDSGNPSYYEYTPEQKWETILNSNYLSGSMTARISGIASTNARSMNAERDITRYEEGVLIPLKTIPAAEIDFLVPVDASEVLTLIGSARKSIFNDQLRNYFRQESWRNPVSDFNNTTEIADDPFSPRYHLGIALHLDIRINGLKADKGNLTITEQYRIQEALYDRQKEFSFRSDGREDPEALKEMAASTYLYKSMDYGFGMSNSIKDLSWYSTRSVAYQMMERASSIERKQTADRGR